jgi:hypothetical protein
MSTLTPHGPRLLWKPALIWLNAVSDAIVAIAFFATAFVLGYYVAAKSCSLAYSRALRSSPQSLE